MNPANLYHYTNINALASILKEKRIRFSSLDIVDDLTEGFSSDLGSMKQFIFVSCWTDSATESIPFWHMYTPQMGGVRIKLPSDMFEQYIIKPDGQHGILGDYISPIPNDEVKAENNLIDHGTFGLLKVKYSKKISELNPSISYSINGNANAFGIAIGKLGRIKGEAWRFQKEWRFRFFSFSSSFLKQNLISIFKQNNPFDYFALRIKNEAKIDRIPKYHFIKLKEHAIEQMEIILGPKIDKGGALLVEDMISKYNPSAKIMKSTLADTFR
jgi:hypothetical protein